MSILGIAWRSLKQRRLSSILTALSIALGVALTIAIMALRDGAESSYHDTARGYDVILGPTHGSPLQVVLNTMFHVGDTGGTIPWSAFEEAKLDGQVKVAVPYAVGDMYRGHHVVGTSTDMFKVLMDGGDVPLGDDVRGRLFRDATGKERKEDLPWEAVVGSMAAAKTGLVRGTEFGVTHGTGGPGHNERWTVVGILRPTGTPADRAIFIPIDTFYAIGDHEDGAEYVKERQAEREAELEKARREKEKKGDPKKGHDHAHDGDEPHDDEPHDDEDHGHAHGSKETLGLSAIGIRLKSPILRLRYRADIRNARGPVQAVVPQDQIRELFDIISPLGRLLTWIVVMMIIVAGIGTMVSLYNTIQGRRREIAILRAVGAKPFDIFRIIVSEALLLCMIGGVAGILLGHLTVILVAPYLLTEAGVFLDAGFSMLDVWILLVLACFGVLIGLLPAIQGLRTPVAENLHPTE